ncbi:hypothetical protein GF312_12060 [Candidatus Poribacteria bacterium]|nr:hypothetical protein [Candidatus Poribacteria bacterium]
MSKILKLSKREYIASVKSKGFIIGLILAPIFMSGSLIALAIFKDRVDTNDKKIAIVDRTGEIAEHLVKAAEDRNKREVYEEETGKKVKPSYLLEIVKPDRESVEEQRLELSDKVRKGQFHAFVDIGPDVIHPGAGPDNRVSYYARNPVMDEIRGWINWPINDRLRKLRLADAGIEESEVGDLFHWVNVEGMGLVTVDSGTGRVKGGERANEGRAIGVPIGMMMLMFLMIMMGVSPMVSSVMEEKTQRIAEVMLGSVRPFEFMMGKVLGSVAVALTSSCIYVLGGIYIVRRMGLAQYIPYNMLPWFFSYMVTAIFMLGSTASALGSTCSEPKDAQSLTFPTILPAMIPMFTMMPVLREPNGSFATGLSLIPPFTPFVMLLRQTSPGGIPAWQPWVGLIGILVFTILSVWVGGRIFRVGILTQGTPPKFSNIVKWAIKG